MPHLYLEYSANLLETADSELLNRMHILLGSFDTMKIADIKSRAIRHEVFSVGEGHRGQGFVHLQIALLPGRSAELKQSMTRALHSFLEQAFSESKTKLGCLFSVELRELEKESYVKN